MQRLHYPNVRFIHDTRLVLYFSQRYPVERKKRKKTEKEMENE